jgi:hypothetical protein
MQEISTLADYTVNMKDSMVAQKSTALDGCWKNL